MRCTIEYDKTNKVIFGVKPRFFGGDLNVSKRLTMQRPKSRCSHLMSESAPWNTFTIAGFVKAG